MPHAATKGHSRRLIHAGSRPAALPRSSSLKGSSCSEFMCRLLGSCELCFWTSLCPTLVLIGEEPWVGIHLLSEQEASVPWSPSPPPSPQNGGDYCHPQKATLAFSDSVDVPKQGCVRPFGDYGLIFQTQVQAQVFGRLVDTGNAPFPGSWVLPPSP